MNEKGYTNRIRAAVFGVSLSVIAVMGFFFFITSTFMRNNMELQTQSAAETIMGSVENELVFFEESIHVLSTSDNITEVACKEGIEMYDAGAVCVRQIEGFLSSLKNIENIIVYNKNGEFYRVKGNASNTVLKRTFFLAEHVMNKTFNVPFGKGGYIAIYENIYSDDKVVGYVVILTEEKLLRRMLSVYNGLDYMGACLFARDGILCANRAESDEEIRKSIDKALFVKDKDIGLSGFKLVVYCENTLIRSVSRYFEIAFPLIIALLLIMFWYFMQLTKRHMITSFELNMQSSHLSLLKKQISAHFTVNTLNVIRALINKGEKESAKNTCDELSKLLRYANGGDEYITLHEEFDVISQYVLIMQTRYPGRFVFVNEEEEFFDEVYIPRMLIQPIVENAIVHGISSGKGTVTITAELKDGDLYIKVKDDGRGMGQETLRNLTLNLQNTENEPGGIEAVALKNIQRRIKILCGDKYGITVVSELNKGTEVIVKLPVSNISNIKPKI